MDVTVPNVFEHFVKLRRWQRYGTMAMGNNTVLLDVDEMTEWVASISSDV